MDASTRGVPVAAMHLVLQTAAGLGLARAELLAEIGVTESQLADRDGTVSTAQQLQLGRLIATKCPGVNIGLAALAHAFYVRPVALVVLNRNLGPVRPEQFFIAQCAQPRKAVLPAEFC